MAMLTNEMTAPNSMSMVQSHAVLFIPCGFTIDTTHYPCCQYAAITQRLCISVTT